MKIKIPVTRLRVYKILLLINFIHQLKSSYSNISYTNIIKNLHTRTVKVNSPFETGGRNQEMCLSAMLELSSHQAPAPQVTFASVGTDGQDGPTDAAGAIVTADSLAGNSSDNCPYKALENNDSYTFFSKLNSGKNLVTTGLTGTNVMDISVLLISGL